MGSHPSRTTNAAATGEVEEELPPTPPNLPPPAPIPPQRQLEFQHPPRVTCDHGWNDGPAFDPHSRESSSDEDEVADDLNKLTLAPSTPTTTAAAAASFFRFLELPTEVQMLIFRHAVEASIGPVRHDPFFSDDLWYTETSLFSSGCTNYPHYMTYHNGGVGALVSPQSPSPIFSGADASRQWVGIGSKVIFKDIMHANRLARQVVFEYWRGAVEKCLIEYVSGDENRKGMDLEGRPINYWMMRALQRRKLVLEVLGKLHKVFLVTSKG